LSATQERESKPKKKPAEKDLTTYPEPSADVKDNVVYPLAADYAKYESSEHLTISRTRKQTERKPSETKNGE
jgi:hypothetical protein